MKASQALKGTRAERVAELPQTLTQSGKPVSFLLRPLNDDEDTIVLEYAAKFARAHGVDGREGEPLYDRAVMKQTLLLGCLDDESPPDNRAPLFASVEEISRLLGREAIALLYQQHEIFQSEVSPLARHLSGVELYKKALEVAASESPDPFVELAPFTQWSFTRSLAILVIGSPELKSHFGLPSPEGPSFPSLPPLADAGTEI